MKRYKFTHFQTFMGETLEGSFTMSINNEKELQEIVSIIYSDPHVFLVEYEELEEE